MNGKKKIVVVVLMALCLAGIVTWIHDKMNGKAFVFRNGEENNTNDINQVQVNAPIGMMAMTDLFMEKQLGRDETEENSVDPEFDHIEMVDGPGAVYVPTVRERITHCYCLKEETPSKETTGTKTKDDEIQKEEAMDSEPKEKTYLQFYDLHGLLFLECKGEDCWMGMVVPKAPEYLDKQVKGMITFEGILYRHYGFRKQGDVDSAPKDIKISYQEGKELMVTIGESEKLVAMEMDSSVNIHTDEEELKRLISATEVAPVEWIGGWTQRSEDENGKKTRSSMWIGAGHFLRIMQVTEGEMPVIFIGAYAVEEENSSVMRCLVERVGYGNHPCDFTMRIKVVNDKLQVLSNEYGDMLLEKTRW